MNTFVVTVTPMGMYQGHAIKINGLQVAHRPYNGARSHDVEREVTAALGALIREKLGWPEEAPEGDEDW